MMRKLFSRWSVILLFGSSIAACDMLAEFGIGGGSDSVPAEMRKQAKPLRDQSEDMKAMAERLKLESEEFKKEADELKKQADANTSRRFN